MAAFLLQKITVMCLRKDNGAYIKKECTRQCNNCKAQDVMQQLLQLVTAGVEESVPDDAISISALLHQNQNMSFNYPLHR